MNKHLLILLFLLVTSLVSTRQTLAYGNGFNYSRSITIDHTKVSNTNQTNFPVLVSGVYSYLATVSNGGNVQNISGYDIGFYTNSDCSTGKMSWETETYASTTGAVNYWVKVATASASVDTVFYVCYGNSSITTDQSSATSVWDSNFRGVWHFPSSTSLSAADSTSYSRNGSLVNAPTAVSGKIGGAANFVAASTQYISLVDNMDNTDTTGTVSAWVYPTTNTQQYLFCMTDSQNNSHVVNVAILNGTASPRLFMQALNIGSFNDAVQSTDNGLTLNAWNYVAFSASGSTYKMYVNGVSQTVSVLAFTNSGRWLSAVTKSTGQYRIGFCNSSVTNYLNSRVDDMRLSDTVRSDDWIKTEYNNQSATSTFYALSSASSASIQSLTTSSPTSVSTSTLTLNAAISSTGGADATQSGFAYGTSATLATVIATSTLGSQTGTATFTSDLTGLTPNTTYYFRAYSTNSAGTGYGSILSTTTISVSAPTVTTQAGTSVATTSAVGNGNITSTGNLNPTVRGFVYGTGIAYGATTTSSGDFSTGAFTGSISSLTCNTLYHYTAYATNSQGTSYGSDTTFTTSPCIQTLTTEAASSVATSTLTLNAAISSTGGADATQSGFAYGTSATLATVIATSTLGSQTGTATFTSDLTGLTPNTTYYFRAYSTNSAGTGYGSILSTTTISVSAPTVTTQAGTSIDRTIATLNGSIDSDGGDSIINSGFEWGTDNTYGTVINNLLVGNIGTLSYDLTGLTCATDYHFRTFATNSAGTASSSDASLTTSACLVPTPTPSQSVSVSGSGSGYSVSSILNTLIPSFLSSNKDSVVLDDNNVTVVDETSPTLEGEWNLLSKTLVNNFVLAPLPNEVVDLTNKFPDLKKLFVDLGISKMKDLERLQDVNITVPTIAENKEIPPGVVVIRNSDKSITLSSTISISTDGEIRQKIETVAGKPLSLSLKPDSPANAIKGYILFKNKSKKTALELPAYSMTASALLSVLNKESKEVPKIENEFLVSSFEYKDLDKDGVYTADISVPVTEGEYEVLSVVTYKDPKKGSKEIRMTTIVDPEGYVYRSNNGEETRVFNANVSIWNASDDTLWKAEQYNQDNPIITDKTGRYSFLVPRGKYYITAEAKGYIPYRGDVFEVKEGVGIHTNIEMFLNKSWLRKLWDMLFN